MSDIVLCNTTYRIKDSIIVSYDITTIYDIITEQLKLSSPHLILIVVPTQSYSLSYSDIHFLFLFLLFIGIDETYKITEQIKQINETYKITERAQTLGTQLGKR